MSEQPPSAGADEPDAAKEPPGEAGPRAFDGVTRFVGMRWEDPQTVRLTIRPELINRGGLLSGVVTYAMVDYCMGSTLWAQTNDDEHIATISISINYIQTAVEGEIVCRIGARQAQPHDRDHELGGAPRGRPPARDGDRQLLDLPRAQALREPPDADADAARRRLSARDALFLSRWQAARAEPASARTGRGPRGS